MTGKLGKTSIVAILLGLCVLNTWATGQDQDPAAVSTRRKGRWTAPKTAPKAASPKAAPSKARLSDRLRAIRGGAAEGVPALPPAGSRGEGVPSAPSRFQAPGAAPKSVDSPREFNPNAAGQPERLRVGSRPVDAPSAGRSLAEPKSIRHDSVTTEIHVELVAPERVSLHRSATWAVRVENVGDRATPPVEVVSVVPASATLAGTKSESGTVVHRNEGPEHQAVVWAIPGIPPRQSVTLELEMVPREARDLGVQLQWRVQPEALAARTVVLEPKLDVAVSGPSELSFGEVGTFTVTLYNPGTGPAEDVAIQIAAGESRAQPRRIGTLAAGEQKTIQLDMTANQSGRIPVVATASADGSLKVEAEHVVVVRRAQLAVALTGPKVQYAGTPATYNVVVANQGDGTARETVVSVALPPEAKLIAASTGAKVVGQELQWSVGELGPGTQRRMQLRCVLAKAGKNSFESRVASGKEVAQSTAVTQVELVADLKLQVNDPQGPQPVSQDVEYQITITNRGSKVARDVVVIAQFSEGMEPTSAVGHEHRVVTGQVLFDPIEAINPGQTITLKVKAKATSQGSHRFRAEVQCDDIDTKLSSEETTRFFE